VLALLALLLEFSLRVLEGGEGFLLLVLLHFLELVDEVVDIKALKDLEHLFFVDEVHFVVRLLLCVELRAHRKRIHLLQLIYQILPQEYGEPHLLVRCHLIYQGRDILRSDGVVLLVLLLDDIKDLLQNDL